MNLRSERFPSWRCWPCADCQRNGSWKFAAGDKKLPISDNANL